MLIHLAAVAAAAIRFLACHTPAGTDIYINPDQISSIREVRPDSKGHFAKGTKCVIVMTNGHTNTVIEDCATIHKMLHDLDEADRK
jgi:hypothetical protein